MFSKTIFLLLGCFGVSYGVTLVYRRYAVRRALLDIPNNRSSHVQPTPRGGGIAIVLAFWLGFALLNLWLPGIALAQLLGLMAATAILTAVSYCDDLGHVAARWRLLAQAVAVFALLWGLSLLSLTSGLAGWVPVLLVFGLMWLINLYNFMDGINGIAALTAVVVSLCLSLLLYWQVAPVGLWLPPLLLAAACCGFLCWNFPRAAIFMGDIGSCFIGLLLAYLVLAAGHWNPEFYAVGLVLLASFIADASLTLAQRALRRQRLYQAHREHAYQHLARRWQSHTPVTLLYALITLVWLLPLSALLLANVLWWPAAVLLAYVPLLAVGLWAGAGRAERGAQP